MAKWADNESKKIRSASAQRIGTIREHPRYCAASAAPDPSRVVREDTPAVRAW